MVKKIREYVGNGWGRRGNEDRRREKKREERKR